MVGRFIAIAIALATSSLAYAQTEAVTAPKTMFGFLKPGMHLGITVVEGTTNLIIDTYTEGEYKVARELNEQLGGSPKTASSIAENNAYVRTKLQEYAAKQNLSEDSKNRIIIPAPIRKSFGTIVTVGDDYLLVKLDDDKRRIIPKASIGTIYLDADPVSFYDPDARARSRKSK